MAAKNENHDNVSQFFNISTELENVADPSKESLLLFNDFDDPDHSCNFNQFVELSNPRDSDQLVGICLGKEQVKRKDRNDVQNKPRLQVVFADDLPVVNDLVFFILIGWDEVDEYINQEEDIYDKNKPILIFKKDWEGYIERGLKAWDQQNGT